MIWLTITALTPIGATLLIGGVLQRFGLRFNFYQGWFNGSIGMGVADLAMRDWSHVALAAANALLAAFLWWLSRRRRKRAPKLAGHKARALIAALVRRAREAAKPRPVLRPAPGGVRA